MPPRVSTDVADLPEYQPLDHAAPNTRRAIRTDPVALERQTDSHYDIGNFRENFPDTLSSTPSAGACLPAIPAG